MHTEAAIGPAATAPIRQHGEEGFFVDGVLTLAETLRAALVSRAEAVDVLLHRPTNPSPRHSTLNRPGGVIFFRCTHSVRNNFWSIFNYIF